MEAGVEDGHVGHAGEQLFHGFNAGEVGGVVQRSEGNVVADDLLHFLGDERFLIVGSAHEHAMTDDHDFGRIVDDAAEFMLHEHFGHLGHAGGMGVVVAGIFKLFGFAVGGEALVGEHAVGGADAFHEALAEAAFGFLFENLILEGGAAAVDDENFLDHYLSPFSA